MTRPASDVNIGRIKVRYANAGGVERVRIVWAGTLRALHFGSLLRLLFLISFHYEILNSQTLRFSILRITHNFLAGWLQYVHDATLNDFPTVVVTWALVACTCTVNNVLYTTY